MSLGHMPPRSQKAVVSSLLGVSMVFVTWDGSQIIAIVIAAIVSSYLCYLLGRSLEHEEMKKEKWHAGESHDQ